MRHLGILLLTGISFSSIAQHCPWDCSGMIIFNSKLPKETINGMRPVLVDENKREIIDTMYGTGLATYDNCNFLYYDDFDAYRKERIKVHHWYQYDTLYKFAKSHWLVKYNFCKYGDQKIYLRYTDRYRRDLKYHYIKIPATMRIHLHEYNNHLRKEDTAALKKELEPFVMNVSFL